MNKLRSMCITFDLKEFIWKCSSIQISSSTAKSPAFLICVFHFSFLLCVYILRHCLPGKLLYPPNNEVVGVYWFHSIRPSVRLSVRLSRLPWPLCNIYSSRWILSILATNDHYHERVCRTQWPLTLTYIFKVIRPWLRKSCPLCSVYSSGWILFIFGTNDHYH